jgi:hypothetical protein
MELTELLTWVAVLAVAAMVRLAAMGEQALLSCGQQMRQLQQLDLRH